jgi:tetratricopeptide (TPR) repeat protein
MKIITILFLIFVTNTVFADRRVELIDLLNEELSEVARLNKQVSSRNPTLLLRMAELHLERARVHKEIENDKYMQITIDQRRNVDKKKIFVKSQEDFNKAQKVCYFIVKNFKNFKGVADVYYILAFNAKEFGDDERAHKYFTGAVKHSKSDSVTSSKSKLALAELYYNKKDYFRAIPYYEDSIKSRSSRWWTKDAYNLAWSYFRANKLNNAITLMREVERLSRDTKYVDLSRDASRDLAHFYTEAGRVDEAVTYYRSNGKDVAENLIRVARNLISQKKYTPAEKILVEARKHTKSEDQLIEINQMLIESYEYMERATNLPELIDAQMVYYSAGKLNQDQKKFIVYVVDRFAAIFQKQVVSQRYAHQPEVNKSKAMIAIKMFDTKAKLQPELAHTAYLLAAETFYSIKNCNDAIIYYEKAATAAKEKNDQKVRKQAGNGIMVCVGDDNLKQETRERYLIPVYLAYLNDSPNDEKSKKIYQRLFVEQIKKNDLAGAEQTFERYRKYFPEDREQQEAFVAKLVDVAEKSNNLALSTKWLKKIYNNEIPVSSNFREGAKAKLLKIQFAEIGQQKDNVSVLKGYLAIFNNNENTRDSKAIAAYNIAGKYYALGYYQKTYIWALKAIELLNDQDLLKFKNDLLLIIGHINDGLEFSLSANLIDKLYPRMCKISTDDAKKIMLNLITIQTTQGEFDQALEVYTKLKQCTPSGQWNGVSVSGAKVYLDNARYLENYTAIEKFIERFGNEPSLENEIIQAHFVLAEIFMSKSDSIALKKYYSEGLNRYEKMKRSGKSIPLNTLEWVAKSRITSLRKIKENFLSSQLSFPEDSFQRQIKNKIKMLDEIVTKGKEIIDLNAPNASMVAREHMIDAHYAFADEVDQFIPTGKSDEYIKSFKTSMQTLTGPLKAQAKELENKLKDYVLSSNALSSRNKIILLNAADKIIMPTQNSDYVLMEREAK